MRRLNLGLVVAFAVVVSGSALAKGHKTKAKAVATAETHKGQSVGKPWSGTLHHASKLKAGDRYHIRRPNRVFGTRTAVANVRRAIRETLDDLPKVHDLAIGDMSEENGGQISGHHSHRTGRDIDIGLFYKTQPKDYPNTFVQGTEANLDKRAMWRLLVNLASTNGEDGGVQVMFLDYKLQTILYKWAKANGVSDTRLNKMFQCAHGKGANAGIIRHAPNHDDHVHVRYACASSDSDCTR